MHTEDSLGRHSTFTEEIGRKVCARIASGESLRQIECDEGMPAASTVCGWVLDYPTFGEQYTRARQMQAQLLADELFSIADDGQNDYRTVELNGKEIEIPDQEHMNRSRLRVDTRKWYLSKVLPKIYGDKLDLNHTIDESLAERITKARLR